MSTPLSSPRVCPVCRSTNRRDVRAADAKRDFLGKPLTVTTCADCAVAYQPDAPSREVLARWYEYMAHDADFSSMTPFVELRLERIFRSFERYRRTGRLLDVGCSVGHLLRVAERRGWQPYGCEISPSCCAVLSPWLGARLHEGDLLDAPFEPASFDVIVMSEVIEHVVDPSQLLRAAHALLRPGGCLYITTPHFRGLTGRLEGLDWWVVTEEHLTYFDRSSLIRILEASGFADVRVHSSGLDLGSHVRRVRGLLRRRGGSSERSASEPVAPRDAPENIDALPKHAATPNRNVPKRGVGNRMRARLLDLGSELVNVGVGAAELGDTLKAFAIRR